MNGTCLLAYTDSAQQMGYKLELVICACSKGGSIAWVRQAQRSITQLSNRAYSLFDYVLHFIKYRT